MNSITSAPRAPLEPATLSEAITLAREIAKSTMIPRDFQGKPENVLIALQWGREIGLGILQSLNSIAVINGRPSVWGDAMLALVRGSGLCVHIHETVRGEGDAMEAICSARRKGDDADTIGRFSVTDAKKANLWGKAGPWQQYPKRMLQLRARGFAIRDAFPDVLRGVISAEEAQDMPAESFTGVTINASGSPATEPETPAVARETGGGTDHGKRSMSAWLDDYERAAAALDNTIEADKLITSPQALWVKDNATGAARQRFDTITSRVMLTWFAKPASDDGPPDDGTIPRDGSDSV